MVTSLFNILKCTLKEENEVFIFFISFLMVEGLTYNSSDKSNKFKLPPFIHKSRLTKKELRSSKS